MSAYEVFVSWKRFSRASLAIRMSSAETWSVERRNKWGPRGREGKQDRSKNGGVAVAAAVAVAVVVAVMFLLLSGVAWILPC